MAALRKPDDYDAEVDSESVKLEKNFLDAVDNPKPAPEYLKEMFRRYGDSKSQKH